MAHSSMRKTTSSSSVKKHAHITAPDSFAKALYANVLAADLTLLSADDRQGIADSIWGLAHSRATGTLNLRLFNPDAVRDGWTVDHTVLEIVNDDMPFLVDSVTGALLSRGLAVHLVIHPVMQVRRDAQGKLLQIVSHDKGASSSSAPVPLSIARAESFIHIQLDHCLDPVVLKEIESELRTVLASVRLAVEDWPKMRQRMQEAAENAEASCQIANAAEYTADAHSFMRWLDNNNFTYLGYRDVDLEINHGNLSGIHVIPNSGLGILRDPDVRMFGGLRDVNVKKTPTLQSYARHTQLIVVTKTNAISHVHRQVPMDAIFIRRFDAKGNVIGERLFVGLFTSQSYSQSPREIPFLNRKIEQVILRAGLKPGSHDSKALIHILNHYLHDELFQIGEDELFANAMGILQLQERARVALFMRHDPFRRFVTCMIYVPRDHYDSTVRDQFEKYLEQAFNGKAQGWHVRIDDSLLARAFVTIQINAQSLQPAHAKLEADLRDMCRSWADHLRDSLTKAHGEAKALSLLGRYGAAFPATYTEAVKPVVAVADIANLERSITMREGLVVDLSASDDNGLLHLKLFQAERPIALSEVLPLIENAGLDIEFMGGPYEVRPKGEKRSFFIHEFVGRPSHPSVADAATVKRAFEESFGKLWAGEVENDPLNVLTLRAGLRWREIVVLRTLARYLRQLRIPYSHEMIAKTFIHHPEIARQIYALFAARHDPDLKGDRAKIMRGLEGKIAESLAKVSVLEEDRIIRRYVNLVQSSLRTNFFQTEAGGAFKSYVSIKFDSRAIEFMPLPKPMFEIFVYSPRVEAVHLRGGKVARGGIRWSDRRDDFRNEILGLVKAQQVKNSVIVPVGSKGGFIVKNPPAEADKFQAEGVACYRVMMCGMLDITDNRVNGKVVPPARVVRHDGDDPYLVVAADKGTAKFSDIANGIAQEYKFWLDDAFASGGSVGYDHKGMGITARGAWEAVKRHFREIGKDIQTTDFTCIGVGDMSGDVFGNGMLLSKHTRLLGAFDHRHIFCDPNPDAAISFAERQRLFNLPRSSWADYDAKKISKGGGVFARSEKAIKLSPEMKKAYGVTADSLAPAELIQVMLKAEVELLYFGGIGTYVKSSDETHEDVGDRATEALRIDGADLRAKIVGEGANLGMTQRGRIEFALKGGRLNTDAIDNSAGVDTSDHEVNIKILLQKIVDQKVLTLPARNKLLSSMTDEVAHLVLRDNYLQTQALTISEARASERLPQHVQTMHLLEKAGLLNRDVECLPHSHEIAERQRAGKGLTRPESSVLLAYSKIWVYEQLLASDIPDDSYTQTDLLRYFPETLRKKFAKDIAQHQLAREIIATVVTNDIINHAGAHSVLGLVDQTGTNAATVTRAYLLVRDTFGLQNLWTQIESLDNRVPAKTQTEMHLLIREVLMQAITWFLAEGAVPSKLTAGIAGYGKGVAHLATWLKANAANLEGRHTKIEIDLTAQGVPVLLAQRIAWLPVLATALDLTRLVDETGISLDAAAEIFFGLGQRLHLDWLLEQGRMIGGQTPWQREALAVVMAELVDLQRRLTGIVAGKTRGVKPATPAQKLAAWNERHAAILDRYDANLNEWRGTGSVDMAMLMLAARQLKTLG